MVAASFTLSGGADAGNRTPMPVFRRTSARFHRNGPAEYASNGPPGAAALQARDIHASLVPPPIDLCKDLKST